MYFFLLFLDFPVDLNQRSNLCIDFNKPVFRVINYHWRNPTSACCTPGGIRRPPLLALILHGTVVVSYVSVLYTRWDPKTPLTDVDTARDCRSVLRQRVVHPVGSEDPPY